MALKPEYSVMSGLAVGAVVFAIHTQFTPTVADVQALPAGNADIDKAERKATYLSAGVVGGVSLLAKDPTIFVVGSAIAVAMALFTRHANHMDSSAGRYLTPSEAATGAAEPVAQSTEPYEMFDTPSDFDR